MADLLADAGVRNVSNHGLLPSASCPLTSLPAPGSSRPGRVGSAEGGLHVEQSAELSSLRSRLGLYLLVLCS